MTFDSRFEAELNIKNYYNMEHFADELIRKHYPISEEYNVLPCNGNLKAICKAFHTESDLKIIFSVNPTQIRENITFLGQILDFINSSEFSTVKIHFLTRYIPPGIKDLLERIMKYEIDNFKKKDLIQLQYDFTGLFLFKNEEEFKLFNYFTSKEGEYIQEDEIVNHFKTPNILKTLLNNREILSKKVESGKTFWKLHTKISFKAKNEELSI